MQNGIVVPIYRVYVYHHMLAVDDVMFLRAVFMYRPDMIVVLLSVIIFLVFKILKVLLKVIKGY